MRPCVQRFLQISCKYITYQIDLMAYRQRELIRPPGLKPFVLVNVIQNIVHEDACELPLPLNSHLKCELSLMWWWVGPKGRMKTSQFQIIFIN